MARQPVRDYGVKNGKSDKGPMWRPNTRNTSSIAWSDIDPNLVRRAIYSCTIQGGALLFSRTSDGGALSLTVMYSDQKVKEYASSKESCEEILLSLINWFDDGASSKDALDV